MRKLVGSVLIGLLLTLSACKDSSHHDYYYHDDTNIFIVANESYGQVNVIASIPAGYYALIYMPPSDVVWATINASSEIYMGHFEPGIYNFCMVLYADYYSDYPYDERHDHVGTRWCTTLLVPDGF